MKTYEQIALQPNPRTEEHFGDCTHERRLMKEVMRVSRSLWPTKTAAELALRAGVSQRTAENWLAFNTGISGPALARLIASEDGMKFIEAVILARGNGYPTFWKRFKQRQETSRMKSEIRQLQLRLDQREAEEDAE